MFQFFACQPQPESEILSPQANESCETSFCFQSLLLNISHLGEPKDFELRVAQSCPDSQGDVAVAVLGAGDNATLQTSLTPSPSSTATISLESASMNGPSAAPAVCVGGSNPAPASPVISAASAAAVAGHSPVSDATTLDFVYEDGAECGLDSQPF